MNIHKAVKKAMEIDGFIACQRWPLLAIKPTDTSDCCKMYGTGALETKSPKCRWQPHAEDLCADDWEAIKSIDELPLGTCTPS